MGRLFDCQFPLITTINKFFGLGLNEHTHSRMKTRDGPQYDCIVFVEIYVCDIDHPLNIYKYCLTHTDKLLLLQATSIT